MTFGLRFGPQELPKRFQDGFKTIQDASKMARMASKIAPKALKDCSKRPPRAQDPPRSAQEVPKGPPRAPKGSPRAPQDSKIQTAGLEFRVHRVGSAGTATRIQSAAHLPVCIGVLDHDPRPLSPDHCVQTTGVKSL